MRVVNNYYLEELDLAYKKSFLIFFRTNKYFP